MIRGTRTEPRAVACWSASSRGSRPTPLGIETKQADDSPSLAVEVIKDFIALDPETQPRNVTAWTPVVTDVLRGSIEFEEEAVSVYEPL